MNNVLVTGASGFIGKALCAELVSLGFSINKVVRVTDALDTLPQQYVVGDMDGQTDWYEALQTIDAVVHLAARVHVMEECVANPLEAFRRTNVEGTLNLARQAALAGVKRFVFISSIKVNGENSLPGRPFMADDSPAPNDAYALTKDEAEQGLRQLAVATGMEVAIIRPPLVYGLGVKANFQVMMRVLHKGMPLPLGGVVANRRSFVALDNLVDLIVLCLTHPAAANQTFLVSDGEDVSTADLLRRLAKALGKKAWLLPVPASLLGSVLEMAGKGDLAQRLCGDLQVDMSKTCQLLAWTPRISLDQGLAQTARHYLKSL
jgi:nucleoside-diphosphate-sugar epimerase